MTLAKRNNLNFDSTIHSLFNLSIQILTHLIIKTIFRL